MAVSDFGLVDKFNAVYAAMVYFRRKKTLPIHVVINRFSVECFLTV